MDVAKCHLGSSLDFFDWNLIVATAGMAGRISLYYVMLSFLAPNSILTNFLGSTTR